MMQPPPSSNAVWPTKIQISMLVVLLVVAAFVRARRLIAYEQPVQNDLGLITVFTPRSPTVDIIAVHGLGANPAYAWRKKMADGKVINWLADTNLLPNEVRDARIMTFNYESRWHQDPIKTRTHTCAGQLLKAVEDNRRESMKFRDRPIIFIAHSFGGNVVEKAIQRSSDVNEVNLRGVVKGIIFLGTPHRGTSTATIPYILSFVARQARGSMDDGILHELSRASTQLQDTLEDFTSWVKKDSISIYCFFEQKCTDYGRKSGISFLTWKKMVVEEDSAVIDGQPRIALPVDHLSMNRFYGPGDDNFKQVAEAVKQCVKEAKHQSPRILNEDECSNCGSPGHKARDCYCNFYRVKQFRFDSGFCLICGQRDHWRKDCPESLRDDDECWNCGHLGHWREDCFRLWHPSSRYTDYP